MKIIDGRSLAEKIKDEITQNIYRLEGLRPNLAIILVGEREDSCLYVSLKEKEGRRVGVDTNLYRFPETASEAEILSAIDFLNNDESIDGILVQLPLPANFDADKIIAALDPAKDVDGFRTGHPDFVVSPVIAAVFACLDEAGFQYRGGTASLFYNSPVFGTGLQAALEERGVAVLPEDRSDEADVLISALGQAQVVKKEVIKEGAILIDIGISKDSGHVFGDIDAVDVKDRAGFLTPVPGGIGPLTIAFLFKNVWEIFRHRRGL